MRERWEYCFINCTRMPGQEEDEHRMVCQLVRAGSMATVEYPEDQQSPVVAIAQALDELGQNGWELVSYDSSTNRGVFKRLRARSGAET